MLETVRDWVLRKADALLVGFGVGALAGVLVRVPLNWQLPPQNASLIGGAVGSVLSVGGAIIAWRVQQRMRADDR
jgi:hypothetical protein